MEIQVSKACQDLQDFQVFLVTRVLMGYRELLVHLVSLEGLAVLVPREMTARMEHKDNPVPRVNLGHQAFQVQREHQVSQEMQVLQVLLAHKDSLDSQDSAVLQVRLVFLVRMEGLEHLGTRDL